LPLDSDVISLAPVEVKLGDLQAPQFLVEPDLDLRDLDPVDRDRRVVSYHSRHSVDREGTDVGGERGEVAQGRGGFHPHIEADGVCGEYDLVPRRVRGAAVVQQQPPLRGAVETVCVFALERCDHVALVDARRRAARACVLPTVFSRLVLQKIYLKIFFQALPN